MFPNSQLRSQGRDISVDFSTLHQAEPKSTGITHLRRGLQSDSSDSSESDNYTSKLQHRTKQSTHTSHPRNRSRSASPHSHHDRSRSRSGSRRHSHPSRHSHHSHHKHRSHADYHTHRRSPSPSQRHRGSRSFAESRGEKSHRDADRSQKRAETAADMEAKLREMQVSEKL